MLYFQVRGVYVWVASIGFRGSAAVFLKLSVHNFAAASDGAYRGY
jgi:hypothetical protein